MNLAEAQRIIERHQAAAPVLVVPLARELGLEVYTTAEWPDTISGMIRRDPERGGTAGYAVYVNGKHHDNRRRFTIAHESAHFILHRDVIGDGIEDDALYRSGLSNRLEAQANYLAADILMPWDLINAAIKKGTSSVEELARLFKVSKSAMSIRLGVPYETTAA
jgi:predicted transcriptional regulator